MKIGDLARVAKKIEGEKTESNNGSVIREEFEEIPITEFPYVTATDCAGTDELNTERFPDMRDDTLVVETWMANHIQQHTAENYPKEGEGT